MLLFQIILIIFIVNYFFALNNHPIYHQLFGLLMANNPFFAINLGSILTYIIFHVIEDEKARDAYN